MKKLWIGCLILLLGIIFPLAGFASYGIVNGSLCGFGEGDGGAYDPGVDEPTLNGPDANVANGFRVRIVGQSWKERTITVLPEQQMEASWFIKNKGDETIDYFESFLYLSEDLDFNPNSDHSYGREEEDKDLHPGERDEGLCNKYIYLYNV